MLTKIQRSVARSLFIARPKVLPGTRVVVPGSARRQWYADVTAAMERENVRPGDVDEFCDIAGVPS